MVKTAEKRKLSKEERRNLLKILTYEKVNGKPIYYRGYEKVLKGELPPKAVMGSSDLRAYIVAVLVAYLFSKLDESKYIVTTNEIGFFTSEDSFRLLDIAVFERKNFKSSGSYTKIPPKVVIEIDTKADLGNYASAEDYALEKTQDLLNAGVEKVVWIFTKPKKVMVAEKGKRQWIVQNWDDEVEIMKGIKLNIEELLSKHSTEVSDV